MMTSLSQRLSKLRKTAENAGDGFKSPPGLHPSHQIDDGTSAMTVADITLAIFGLCNTFRVLAYVPQIVKAATDKDRAKAISLATWALFLASHLSAAAYASINASDWTLAGVFLGNAVGAGRHPHHRGRQDGTREQARSPATGLGALRQRPSTTRCR